MKQRALIAVQKEIFVRLCNTPSDQWHRYWMKKESKFDTKYGIELPAFLLTHGLKLWYLRESLSI
jgi:hypothetical protein